MSIETEYNGRGIVISYDYLEHHGILGQKWGIRRYQNPDGTLTEEGKKRLQNYKKTEAVKLASSFQRLEKKHDREVFKAGDNVLKLDEIDKKYARIGQRRIDELHYLNTMSFDEMRREEKWVNRRRAGLTFVTGPLVGGTISAVTEEKALRKQRLKNIGKREHSA